MFVTHDMIDVGGDPPARLRVLWVSNDRATLALVDITDPSSWPALADAEEAQSLVASGTWGWCRGEPPGHPLDHEVSEDACRRRDESWRVIEAIIQDGVPGIFDRLRRARLVTEATKQHCLARTTVDRLLLRYFHGGMVKAALTPRWSACGGRGLRKTVDEDTPKRGAPVLAGAPPGVNVTPEMRRLFRLGVSLSYARARRHNFATAYHLCMREFFSREVEDIQTGKLKHVPVEPYDELGLPTERQFRYWSRIDNDLVAITRRRLTPRVYDMTRRPLLGNPTAMAFGPCSRFQIDATVLDVYIRSRRNRRLIIGRPTLYVVIDVFSRMIVGIYVGLESPSWVAAMMALANAAKPKAEFCRSIGVDIESHEWPAQHIPFVVAGDRGEMLAAKVDPVLLQFNIVVENAAPYRADWKGVVEARFHILPAIFKPYVPGYVETDFRQRGAPDYRAEAVLDLDDLYKIVVNLILYYNNHHALEDYPRHPGLTEDNIPSVPLDLWNWGIANLSGTPRPPLLDRFHFALMPKQRASVTPQGILFEGRLYTCPRAVTAGWFEKARQKRFSVDISHDKRLTDYIYVHDREEISGFSLGSLTERSANQRGLSCWEAEAMNRSDRVLHANRRTDQIMARADAEAKIERIVAAAEERIDSVVDGSIRSQVRGIQDARMAEKAADRLAEGEAFRAGMVKSDSFRSVDVIPITPLRASSPRGRPSLADRRRAKDNQDG